jgi:hypothetical protein
MVCPTCARVAGEIFLGGLASSEGEALLGVAGGKVAEKVFGKIVSRLAPASDDASLVLKIELKQSQSLDDAFGALDEALGPGVGAMLNLRIITTTAKGASKLKGKWGVVRKLARQHGFSLPRRFKNGGLKAAQEFLDSVVANPKATHKIQPFKPTGGGSGRAVWTKLGNTVVIRRPNLDFLTIVEAGSGIGKNF